MPTPNNVQAERLTLLIDNKAHDDWDRYEVDSDLFIPADAWSLELGIGTGQQVPKIISGTPIRLMLGDDVVMSGALDTRDHSVHPTSHTLSLRGRDGAGQLVDSSAPVFASKQNTLSEIVNSIVKPLGIRKVRVLDKGARQDKVNVEPGDMAWDALQHAAEAAGLWPWFDPDGTLVVGGPDYKTPEVGTLVLGPVTGNEMSVESLQEVTDLQRRVSEITVLGQAHGSDGEGQHAIKVTVKDPSMTIYRPKVVIDHEANNRTTAQSRGRKLLADSRLNAYLVAISVKGHRAPNGKPWQPGMRVRVRSAVHGIDAVLFCTARKFKGGRDQPSLTLLTLREDGVWVLDAHPHQRKHRRGKNYSGDVLETDDK